MKYYFYSTFIVLSAFSLYLFFKYGKKHLIKWIVKLAALYRIFTILPIVGRQISLIHERLYLINPEDEERLRFKAVFFYLVATSASILTMAILWAIYGTSFYMILTVTFLAIVVYYTVLDFLVSDDTKLLIQFKDFLTDVKHEYNLISMVKESIQSAVDKAPFLMNQHGKKIIQALSNEEEFNNYLLHSKSKLLKKFIGHAFIVQEYGDKNINGQSLFIRNINSILDEVELELIKRRELKNNLMFITPITIFPILLPDVIESWVKGSFEEANFFYNGIWGQIVLFAILLITAGSYAVIRYIRSLYRSTLTIKNPTTWDKTLLKIKPIKNLIHVMQPKTGTKLYLQEHELLQTSGSNYDFDGLYVRKLVAFIGLFLLTVGFFIALHSTQAQSIINTIKGEMRIIYLYDVEGNSIDIYEVYGAIVKDSIDSKEKEVGMQKISAYLKEKRVDVGSPQALEAALFLIDKINADLNGYYNEHLKVRDILIAFVIATCLMDIPKWILYFQRYIRKYDLEEELFQFKSIILLLMHHETTSIQTILEWMERFADIYYNPIRRCNIRLQNAEALESLKQDAYDSLGRRSLDDLKEDVKYKPFVRLVDNLIVADKIGVRQAFETLENEWKFYFVERKMAVERLIKNRTTLGEIFGVVPFCSMIGLYLILPLLWASIREANNIFNMFKF